MLHIGYRGIGCIPQQVRRTTRRLCSRGTLPLNVIWCSINVPFSRHWVGDRTVTPSPDVVVRFRHLAIQDPEYPCGHRLSNRRSSPFRGAASVTLSPRTSREVPSGEPQCPGWSRQVKPPRRLPRLSASVRPARSPPSDRQTGIGSFGCEESVSLEKALLRECLTGFSGDFSIPRGENDGPACSARRPQRVSASPTPSWTSPFGFSRSNREEQDGHSAEQVSKPKPGPSPARHFWSEDGPRSHEDPSTIGPIHLQHNTAEEPAHKRTAHTLDQLVTT